MARGRIISKSIATSEKVNLMLRNPLDCLLYTWGLCHADDEGRIEGNPITFRGKVAPMLPGLTDTRVDLALTAMEKTGLITRYTVQGVMTIQFFDWNNHQSFNGRHKIPSKLPPIPKDIKTLKSVQNTESLSQSNLNEVNINKDKESTFAPNETKLRSVPKIHFDFSTRKWANITEQDFTDWQAVYPATNPEAELGKMAMWLLGNPTKRKSNYRKFITNWLNRSQDKGGR